MFNLKPWKHPTTGQIRYYINARYADGRSGIKDADGHYIREDKNGKVTFDFNNKKIKGDGTLNYHAIMVLFQALGIKDKETDWNTFVERVENSKTKSGNFSYTQYRKKYM